MGVGWGYGGEGGGGWFGFEDGMRKGREEVGRQCYVFLKVISHSLIHSLNALSPPHPPNLSLKVPYHTSYYFQP